MEEIIKIISDYGIVFVMMAGLVLLFSKYIPTLMNIWIDRLKTRNTNNDLVLEVVRNNTEALKNSTSALNNNTLALEGVRKRDNKTNQELDKLHEKADEIAKDIAIIKEKKK